ncbi:MAG: hypothetical protein IK004_09620 [Bacteroidales bacterium]|nr:hypothetical protein [Bacteroidales bacterium]
MKSTRFIIIALAFIVGLAQCKKNNDVFNAIDDNMIDITINVADGAKINVNTSTGAVTFERYDELHIVSDGKYCGFVSKTTANGPFTGSIKNPTEGVPMYIYYLGVHNKHYKTIDTGSTSCKIDITDQTSSLPVISCGKTGEYTPDVTSYSVNLDNKCALVKFNVTTSAGAKVPTCLAGLRNEMIIDFKGNTFTPDTVGESMIKLAPGSGERWAILLPNAAEVSSSRAYSEDYRYVGTRSALGAINYNDFITKGYDVTVNTSTTVDPTYNDHKFSLSATKRVLFASGNVQHVYNAEKRTWIWKFAEHQYDMLDNDDVQIKEGRCDRDRFGWGTGNNPDNMSHSNSDYPQSTNEFVDWGRNFPEGGSYPWFAPKCVEWRYLMFQRTTTELNGVYNARYARARVNGVKGVILFPDVYSHPVGVTLPTVNSINYTNNNGNGSYSDNNYTEDDWNKMAASGAVFLPITGQRVYSGGWNISYLENGDGHYWSQCDLDDPVHACNLYFTDYRPYVQDKDDKCKGFAVRLVRE